MKIHEYNEMMAYLTRPATRQPAASGGRIGFQPGGLSKKEKIAQGLEKGRVSTNIDIYKEVVQEYNKAIQKALDTNDASKLPKPFAQILKEKSLKDGTYHSLKNNKQIPIARDVSTNRFKLANTLDDIIEKKLEESEESQIYTNKDMADLLMMAHKMRMDEIKAMAELEKAKTSNVKNQTNVQINELPFGQGNYGKLMEKLLK